MIEGSRGSALILNVQAPVEKERFVIKQFTLYDGIIEFPGSVIPSPPGVTYIVGLEVNVDSKTTVYSPNSSKSAVPVSIIIELYLGMST